VTGAQKALALQKCVEGGVNHMFTLSALHMHERAMIVCDEDATFVALETIVDLVQYFKSIGKVAETGPGWLSGG
jgi:glucosamine-6-phosphate deaminase